jgi:hypothetical protein
MYKLKEHTVEITPDANGFSLGVDGEIPLWKGLTFNGAYNLASKILDNKTEKIDFLLDILKGENYD